ncbi:MAG: hypothetical protein ACTSU7_09925 [Candidatus Heimdallarchaeaceae archaeon]
MKLVYFLLCAIIVSGLFVSAHEAVSEAWEGGSMFDYDNTNVEYNIAPSGELSFDWRTGSPARNRCANNDCSAGYGLNFEITSEILGAINNGKKIILSFDYGWDGNDNPFESSDELWIKGRITEPNLEIHYLGCEMSNSGNDETFEVDFIDNPDIDFSNTFSQDITEWITSEGTYYLEIGGKLRASESNEWGEITFDNIEMKTKKPKKTRVTQIKKRS